MTEILGAERIFLIDDHELVREFEDAACPKTDSERFIAEIWADVLGVGDVPVTADFFLDLSGHSLVAAQMVTKIREITGCPLTVRDAHEFTTVRRLTTHLNGLLDAVPPTGSSVLEAATPRSARPRRTPHLVGPVRRPRPMPSPRPRADLSVYSTPASRQVRTLLDVLEATAREHPDAPALDDGRPMTYRVLMRRVGEVAAMLRSAGVGTGDRVGVRMTSGTAELYLAILGVLTAGAAYVPVDADDPDERAATIWEEAEVCGVLGDGMDFVPRQAPAAAPGASKADAGRRRLDHLHLGVHGEAQGCGDQPPLRGGVR